MRGLRDFDTCPHSDAIQFCPLYVAAHSAKHCGLSCMGARVEDDYGSHCDVERRTMNYAGAVSALRLVAPLLVAQCEFGKMKHEAQAQRARNMRAMGIH